MFFSISSKVHEDTQFVLATTRDRCIEKEDLASYVSRKREMFLVEYALGVKRDEIRKLEEIAKVMWGRRWDKGEGDRSGQEMEKMQSLIVIADLQSLPTAMYL